MSILPSTLYCRRCHTYDCKLHGTVHPPPTDRVDPSGPLPCPVSGLNIEWPSYHKNPAPGKTIQAAKPKYKKKKQISRNGGNKSTVEVAVMNASSAGAENSTVNILSDKDDVVNEEDVLPNHTAVSNGILNFKI